MNYVLAGLGIAVIVMINVVVILAIDAYHHASKFDDNDDNDCGV